MILGTDSTAKQPDVVPLHGQPAHTGFRGDKVKLCMEFICYYFR